VGDLDLSNAGYILVREPERKDKFGDIGADKNIVLKWILRKQDMRICTGFFWLRIGSCARPMRTR
jgi:hypothetical protein